MSTSPDSTSARNTMLDRMLDKPINTQTVTWDPPLTLLGGREISPAEETLRTEAIEVTVAALPSLREIITEKVPHDPRIYVYDSRERIVAIDALARIIEATRP